MQYCKGMCRGRARHPARVAPAAAGPPCNRTPGDPRVACCTTYFISACSALHHLYTHMFVHAWNHAVVLSEPACMAGDLRTHTRNRAVMRERGSCFTTRAHEMWQLGKEANLAGASSKHPNLQKTGPEISEGAAAGMGWGGGCRQHGWVPVHSRVMAWGHDTLETYWPFWG